MADRHEHLQAVKLGDLEPAVTLEDCQERCQFLRTTLLEVVGQRNALRTQLDDVKRQRNHAQHEHERMRSIIDELLAAIVARGGEDAVTSLLRDVARGGQVDLNGAA